MRTQAVRPYYDALHKKQGSLYVKRVMDLLSSALLLVLLSPLMLVLAAFVALDSPGGVFYRQQRVTAFGRQFFIFKFRTMVSGADRLGPGVTQDKDSRVTRAGRVLRRLRLDEVPQLINIFLGDMTLVGTRPEAPRYVAAYTDAMQATLLLPAGLTSKASLRFRNEAELLAQAVDVDQVYVTDILPKKMQLNLEALMDFSLFRDLKVLLSTVLVLFGKEAAE